MVDKALGVRERRANRIIAVMGPVAVAVAALIERDAVIFVAQRQADEVPGMRRQGAAMQEDDGRQMLVAPIEIVKPHPAEVKFMALRQYHLAKAEAGPHGGRGKVLAVFLGGQAHGVGASFCDLDKAFSTKSSFNACFAMQQGYAPPACALFRRPGE